MELFWLQSKNVRLEYTFKIISVKVLYISDKTQYYMYITLLFLYLCKESIWG